MSIDQLSEELHLFVTGCMSYGSILGYPLYLGDVITNISTKNENELVKHIDAYNNIMITDYGGEYLIEEKSKVTKLILKISNYKNNFDDNVCKTFGKDMADHLLTKYDGNISSWFCSLDVNNRRKLVIYLLKN